MLSYRREAALQDALVLAVKLTSPQSRNVKLFTLSYNITHDSCVKL